ncbi:cystatin family protein [Nocardia suismassiliense]|uniref:cystatin family protein n=1 Tax=Nocardia suismassiliense TaxID=2077092 RepID=UPI00131EE495|nr:cystatin family protein [Nocardia suismassiliense]
MTGPLLRLSSIPLIAAGVAITVCAATAHAEPSSGGEWSAADVKSREVADAAAFAVDEVQFRFNTQYYVKLIRIVDAQKRVAAAVGYRIVLDIAETLCSKTETVDANCAVNPQGWQHRCIAIVYTKPWEHFTTLQKFDCGEADPDMPADVR